MMNEHRASRILTVLLFVLTFALSALCAERVVDLTAADGTRLKATYFSAAKPGPGVLLLHQCNRQRKVWDDLGATTCSGGNQCPDAGPTRFRGEWRRARRQNLCRPRGRSVRKSCLAISIWLWSI